jgi:DNA replicative helicase MCM subunit Mcm2 (Cdc46/Mcm family)
MKSYTDNNLEVPIHKVQRFEDFFRLFEERPCFYKYQDRITETITNKRNDLIFDYEDLLAFDSQIAYMLRNDPEALLEDAVKAFKNIFKFLGGKIIDRDYFVRVSTRDEESLLKVSLKDLSSKYLSKLIISEGKVIDKKVPEIRLEIGCFKCLVCLTEFEIYQPLLEVKRPRFCINPRCKNKTASDFRLLSRKSYYYDYQFIKIQENMKKIKAVLTHDLVDEVNIGDIIELTGIYTTDYDYSKTVKRSNAFRGIIIVNNVKILNNTS